MWSMVHFCPFVNVFFGGDEGERSWGKGEEGEAQEIITARRVVDISKTYCGVGAGPVLLPCNRRKERVRCLSGFCHPI